MTLHPGKLLIASPKLIDPNFYRTVILCFQFNEDGAAGLVLNRPTPVGVGEVWENVSTNPCPLSQPIFWGGPVEGPLMILHSRLMLAEISLLPCVLFSVDREHVVSIVEDGKQPVRLFSGYSGWGPGQLDAEILEGSWFVSDTNEAFVFSDPDTQWKRACQLLGEEVLFKGLGIRLSGDPLLN